MSGSRKPSNSWPADRCEAMVDLARFVITWWWPVLLGLLSVVPMVVGLYIGWRAMRAHERLASTAEQIARSAR